MELPKNRRGRRRQNLEFSDRRQAKQTLYLRLTPQEEQQIAELAERMGGTTFSAAVEEALRRYLPAVAAEAAFVRLSMAPSPPLPRRYKIRRDIDAALRSVCEEHGWRVNEVARHALKACWNQARTEAKPDGKSRQCDSE
jgi:hypothetical protein